MIQDPPAFFVEIREQMITDWSAVGLRRLERYLARCAEFEEYCRLSGREWSAPEAPSCQRLAPCQ
jgi:hypothetical protein